jgi:methenyltetrahydromethanopterin cyclohydrolase
MTSLNERAWEYLHKGIETTDHLSISIRRMECGTLLVDAGVEASGGQEAGLLMAATGMANLGSAQVELATLNGSPWPGVSVRSDHPLQACFLSQAAHWSVQVGDFRAMGSGPACLLNRDLDPGKPFGFQEQSDCAVLVLETRQLPDEDVCRSLAATCGVEAERLMLLVAPTSSLAGSVQIAARSIETGLHKLLTRGFNLGLVVSGMGRCPLATPTGDDILSLGMTNDLMMVAGQVWLAIRGASDDSLAELANVLPASTSPGYGPPFLEAVRKAGGFYQLDAGLFAPAEVTLVNLDDGRSFHSGTVDDERLAAILGE